MKHPLARSPWRTTAPPSLSLSQKAWLMRPGALTAGLRLLGTVELRVLREFSAGLTADEACGLRRPLRSAVWIREVAMRINGVDCVVARSLTPLQASHGIWQGMRRLRTRPLADILYHEPSIVRSAFEVARLVPGCSATPFMSTVASVSSTAGSHTTLLARRSVFWRDRTPLLVAECFLPAFWQMQ